MSQESISFFEDKTTEQIINWMIAHLSESQLRACLNSAGINPEFSAGPSSSRTGAGPSSSGAGSSSDPLPPQLQQIPQFSPPSVVPRVFPEFNIGPYIDTDIEARQINPLSAQDLQTLIKYVGYQVESKEDIKKAFPNVDEIGLSAIPVYIYNYIAPEVFFIGFLNNPSGLYVTPFRAPTLKIFKQIGFELLRLLNSSIISGQYKLKPGLTITKEMQKAAKVYSVLKNKEGIMTNTLQIMKPDYINDVVRPYIANMKMAKFGLTENYNEGNIFDDLTVDDFEGYNENAFGNEDNIDENEIDNDNYTDIDNQTQNEYSSSNGDESIVSKPSSKMRVYDMDPEQLNQHMINKFGSKFANDYTAEKYINSNGVPAVKYIKTENTSGNTSENLDTDNDRPIISGFGEDSEEENLF
jgi:hypothetical protein